MTPDIHTLTGAYAVDALPDTERELFEEHLDACEACQLEVAELQATAAALGAAQHERPPASLRDAVLAEVDRTRQEPPLPSAAPAAEAQVVPLRPSFAQRLLAPAAAILTLAVIGLTVVLGSLNARMADLEAMAAPVTTVLTAPDAITLAAEGADGSRARIIAAPSVGEGVIFVDDLEPMDASSVYQLWLVGTDGIPTPAGLLHVDDRGRGAHVMTGDMSGVAAVALTREPAGGSPTPTSDPVVVVPLDG
jgi:anti-sigma-K factor RskA